MLFEEYICIAHTCISEILPILQKFIFEYANTMHCDKEFLEKLEIDLIYLENFYKNIDDVIELIDKIQLNNLELPIINNVLTIDNYRFIPDDYDKEDDFYVDINNQIDFTKYKKHNDDN